MGGGVGRFVVAWGAFYLRLLRCWPLPVGVGRLLAVAAGGAAIHLVQGLPVPASLWLP